MRTYNGPRFESTISQKLRIIASDDDLATLRQVIADAQRGRRPWRPWHLAFVASIVERIRNSGDHTTM